MLSFSAILKKFGEQGEKTGWTYLEVSKEQAHLLQPNTKKSFRVKGKLDSYAFEGVALVPIGEGNFIIAVNATMRQAIKKRKGDTVQVQLAFDEKGYQLNEDFMACLNDEPKALTYFNTLPKGHQNYFSKWIESAKTMETTTKRITMAVMALAKQMGYPEMIRANKVSSE
ncbi:YdeI/OmpD-associated family protein [Parasediminibacterium paludis]|uniref:YdeI/OmpD-associated family protein n=1 Tax=Parasediminibacterium paludis TaxID=908966 RepID=A0ABV8PZR5_9BACT